MAKAFSTVRILDFSRVIAGPYAVQMFNMLGAEVIKVEEPGKGDQMRHLMPASTSPENASPGFMAYNSGKKSIAIDLKAPDAREVITKLVETSDIMIESFKAGTIKKLGYGYEEIKKIKPDIIYCSISGFGQSGPNAGKPAYDGAVQAAAGMMASTGHPETGPTRAQYLPVDTTTGYNAAFAMAAALYRRQLTGEGQYIDVAMLDSAITVQAVDFSCHLMGDPEPPLIGNKSPSRLPTADCFETQEGYLLITALSDAQVGGFMEMLGLSALLDDPRFADNEARTANAAAIQEHIIPALMTDTADNWAEKLEAARVPFSKVRSMAEVAADPQLKERKILAEVPLGALGDGTATIVGPGYLTNVDGPEIPGPPPAIGEHSEKILRSIGYTDDQIGALQLT